MTSISNKLLIIQSKQGLINLDVNLRTNMSGDGETEKFWAGERRSTYILGGRMEIGNLVHPPFI